MDYSIHDAIEAGFNHVVFIIWKDTNDIPDTLSEGRTKLWGTGQAVLAAKKVINTPFIVINADDYYEKSLCENPWIFGKLYIGGIQWVLYGRIYFEEYVKEKCFCYKRNLWECCRRDLKT